MELNLSTIGWFFMLAAVWGWGIEVIYYAVLQHRFVNVGILNGPYRVEFGLMYLVPLLFLELVGWQGRPMPTFLSSLAGSVVINLVVAYGTHRCFDLRLRDLSGCRWTLFGYVSIPIAAVRAVGIAFATFYLNPVILALIGYIPTSIRRIVPLAFMGILLLDGIIALITMRGLQVQARSLSELSEGIRGLRDHMGNALSSSTVDVTERIDELDLDDKLRDAQRNAEESYTALLNRSNFFKRRFLRSAPELMSDHYNQELKDIRITTEQRKKRQAKILARNRYEYEGSFTDLSEKPFAFGMNFTKIFWIFLIGCVVGFLLEECWALFIVHTLELRVGLVYGPFQPIYGGGAVLITLGLYRLYKEDSMVIFICSAVIGGGFEYICSWAQQKLFHTVSWDYSGTLLNIDGRTNLMFGIIWGTLGLVWVKTVYPAVSRLIEKIPKKVGSVLTVLLLVFMIFDGAISCAALVRSNERHQGIPATSAFQTFLDEHLDDAYLALVYPNMQHVNEDGSKGAPMKDQTAG